VGVVCGCGLVWEMFVAVIMVCGDDGRDGYKVPSECLSKFSRKLSLMSL